MRQQYSRRLIYNEYNDCENGERYPFLKVEAPLEMRFMRSCDNIFKAFNFLALISNYPLKLLPCCHLQLGGAPHRRICSLGGYSSSCRGGAPRSK